MKFPTLRLFVFGLLVAGLSGNAPAQEPAPAATTSPAAALPPVIARYEQMLAAAPAKGTAFDKIYQDYFAGDGLDALATRWQMRAAMGGPGAESFLLLQGLLAERRARPDEARSLYAQYAAARPHDPRGWTALGELETAAGRFGPSAEALAHALDPDAKPPVPVSARPALYRELARAQTRDFLVAAALGTWRQLAAEFPDDPGVLQEVGEAFQEEESYDEARATFEKVRALARRDNDVFGRINATLRTGQVEEARGHAKEAIGIYESVVAEAKAGGWLEREARARIEQLYRGQEDLPGLADYYQKSLEDQPNNVETATRRAAVLMELNRRGEAIDLLKQAVAWAPDRQELSVELARRLTEGNRAAEAAAVMERLTAAAPEEKSYWQLLGDARWRLLESLPAAAPADDQTRLRAQALEAWHHLAPADGKPDPAATGQLADLLATHHLADEALAQYARAAAQAPDLPDTHERWAAHLAQLGRKDEARRVVAGIVSAAPKNATAANYHRLASALDRLDDPDGALDATARGLALEPRNFDLLALRWQLLTTRKRWDDAVALYPALFAAAPNVYFIEQVQTRHLTALQAAGKFAATRQALAARLGGEPPLDEGGLALLVRADLQPGGDDAGRAAEARRALAEGRGRFPQSAPFARLESELAKQVHDAPGQVAALRRLVELQPAQRTDALAKIARVWRDAGQDDQAIAAAGELVTLSPASASSHLLLADLLLQNGRRDEAVARLRDAVRLSDKPNGIRLRLTRIETDLGRSAEARQTLDEAFEAAGDAHERLALMRPLTAAYQADNRLDELIARFQRFQQGEADGWRYALYLSELYQQTQDFAAARRELAKALAARPKDGALLRQLVRLAAQENNIAEVARYQTLLTEAEPSDQNKFALVAALLNNTQPVEALNALRANLAAVLKVPGAWNTLLPLLARNDLTGKAGELLTAELGAGNADAQTRFTLALFQAAAGNADGARAAFWSVFDTRPPRARSPAPAPAPSPATAPLERNERLARLFYGGSSAAEQRFSDATRVRSTAQAAVAPGGLGARGYNRGFGAPSLNLGSGTGSAPANGPDPVDTARDTALLYLAALAVQDNTAEEFLAELDRHLAARDSTRADRLIAYSLLDFTESQVRELAAQVQTPEEGLDGFCLSRLLFIANSNSPNARRYSPLPPLTPAQTAALAPLFDPLLDRMLRADPDADADRANLDLMRYYFLVGIEQKDRAEEVRRRVLAGLDEKAPADRLETALDLLILGDFSAPDRAKIRAVCRALGEARQSAPAPWTNQFSYYPGQIFQDDSAAAKLPPAEFAGLLADLLSLWYPVTAPAVGSQAPVGPGNPHNYRRSGSSPRDDAYLPANRFLEPATMAAVQSIAQQLAQADAERLKALRGELDRQAAELPPARRVYPRLLAVYLAALGNDLPGALTGARALLADSPDDADLRLLTGVLLGRNDQPAEAVALLRTVDLARTGETPVNVQGVLLKAAQAAKDTETARAVAWRLVALRPTGDDREALVNTLKELDLTEQAEQLGWLVSGGTPPRRENPSLGRPASVLNAETVSQFDALTAKQDEAGALALARKVFAALPPPLTPNGNLADYAVSAAVRALKGLKQWDAFVAETEKALAKDPDSLSLNYQLAALYGDNADRHPDDQPDPAAVYWRKVVALRPKEPAYLLALARHLAQSSGQAEAAECARRLVALNPDAAFANVGPLIEMYGPAGLPELAASLLAWKPAATGPAPRGYYYGHGFQSVVSACERAKRPDLVIALGRRAAELDRTPSNVEFFDLNTRQLLLTALLETGRRDEARDTLLSYYLPPADANPVAANQTTLGFRNPQSGGRSQGARNALSSISWGTDRVELPGLEPLQTAASLGLLPDFQSALSDRQMRDPEHFVEGGLDWLLTLVRVDGHDPAVLDELPARLQALLAARSANVGYSMEARAALFLDLSGRLLRWPGQEAMAGEALRAAGRALTGSTSANHMLAGVIHSQEAQGQLLLGDLPAALATVREEVSKIGGGSISANDDEARRCLGLLSRCGPDADPAYLDLYKKLAATTPDRRESSLDLDLEHNLRAGDNPQFRASAWLLDDAPNGDSPDTTLVYEICPVRPSPEQTGADHHVFSRGRSFAGSERARTLTISHGLDAAHLAALGQLQTGKTFGTWTGSIPRGPGVLKISIDNPRSKDTATQPSPAADAEETLRPERPSQNDAVPILHAANLLTNPAFDGLAERPAGEKFSLAGWPDLPAGFWKIATGESPFPGHSYVRCLAGDRSGQTVRAARLPVEGGRSYFLSGWLRGSGMNRSIRLGVYFLDAAGQEIGSTEDSLPPTFAWMRATRRLHPAGSDAEGETIPPRTAFFEPFIRFTGPTEWTGLFLGKVD